MRLIDSDAVLARVNSEWKNELWDADDIGVLLGLFPTVGIWIPIGEELPKLKHGDAVIISTYDENGKKVVACGDYWIEQETGKFGFDVNFPGWGYGVIYPEEVEAYMKLPEPYEEDK